MSSELIAVLALALAIVAFLYSSVGHAGASGYIAVMSLLSMSPAVIKPTGLVLNILVASIASWQFVSAGNFQWRLFWPFAVFAFPASVVGGYVTLPTDLFKVLVGGVLLVSAIRFLSETSDERPARPPSVPIGLVTGAALGLLAGLTGTGGGIFLTPLLLLMGWARAKVAAGVSAPFILLNSVGGLAGNLASTEQLPDFMLPLAIAVVLGGSLGSHLGSRRFAPLTIKRLLAVVLLVAGAKLILV